jgi:hypothetical protein
MIGDINRVRDRVALDLRRYNIEYDNEDEREDDKTLELVALRGLQQLAILLWPDEYARGMFSFLETSVVDLYEEVQRTKADGSKIRGRVLGADEMMFHAEAGLAVALLRTETMCRQKVGAKAALETVSGWTCIETDTLRKWTPAFGAVKSAGPYITEADEKTDILKVLLRYVSAEDPIRTIKKRLISARNLISARKKLSAKKDF